MRAASSADSRGAAGPTARTAGRVLDVPAGVRAAMVVLGWIPAAHVLLVLTPLGFAAAAGDWRLALLSPALLYLLPPVAVRLLLLVKPLTYGRMATASGPFLRWWATAQWQIVFTRLPWLEESLRLMPGLYSAWLRLWGARIGSFVYWAPGLVVLDRPLVEVGDRVAFGMGVRLNPHAIAPGPGGRGTLFVAPISIGADALIGAYSVLLPGCEVAGGEVTPPFRSIHAFSRFEGGRRIRLANRPAIGHPDAP